MSLLSRHPYLVIGYVIYSWKIIGYTNKQGNELILQCGCGLIKELSVYKFRTQKGWTYEDALITPPYHNRVSYLSSIATLTESCTNKCLRLPINP